MPTIDLSPKVKEKLKEYMAREGIKTYSDAVNLLLSLENYGKEILDEVAQKFDEFKKEVGSVRKK